MFRHNQTTFVYILKNHLMICKKQEIITKKYTYMDLQKISKNNHHVFTLHKKKTFLGAQCGVLDM